MRVPQCPTQIWTKCRLKLLSLSFLTPVKNLSLSLSLSQYIADFLSTKSTGGHCTSCYYKAEYTLILLPEEGRNFAHPVIIELLAHEYYVDINARGGLESSFLHICAHLEVFVSAIQQPVITQLLSLWL